MDEPLEIRMNSALDTVTCNPSGSEFDFDDGYFPKCRRVFYRSTRPLFMMSRNCVRQRED